MGMNVCMSQSKSNVVLTKIEYEKLLQERNKLRGDIILIRTQYITLKDSVTHIVEVPKVVITNDCDEFKRRIASMENFNAGLKNNNISIVTTNRTLQRRVIRFRRRSLPNTGKSVGLILLGSYTLYSIIDQIIGDNN